MTRERITRNGVSYHLLEHAGPGGYLDKPQFQARPEGDKVFSTRPKRAVRRKAGGRPQ